MKRPIIALTVCLVFAFILSSCGTSSSTTASITPSSPSITQSTTAAKTSSPASTSTTSSPSTATKGPTPVPTTITTSAPPAAQAPKYGGTAKIVTQGPGAPIGYPGEGVAGSFGTTNYCTDMLFRGDDKGNLNPALITSYDTDPGSKSSSVTFHLRKGVKFHDGSDWNAQALKWNLEMIKSSPLQANVSTSWTSFEVIDDYTLKVNMTAWQNRFLAVFGNSPLQMVSPTAYQKNGVDWMRWNIVGTGPFVQTDFQRDVVFKAKRNDNYWDTGKPYLDGLQLLYVVDAMTSRALFLSGGADVISVGANLKLASELQASGYQIAQLMVGGNHLMPDSMNADSPWSNPKVRLAAEYAIDKESMVKALGYGFLTASYQVPSPNSLAYNPILTPRKYDLTKAKQLLSEAGYPNGFKTTLIFGNQTNLDVAAAVQAFLAKVGIQANLEITDAAKTNQYMSGTWRNALLFGSPAEAPNFSITLNAFFRPGTGPGLWMSVKKPDGYLEAYNAALTSPEPNAALFKKCIDLFYDDATVIPLFNAPSMWAIGNNLQDAGFGKRMSMIQNNPQDAWFKK